MINMQKSKTGFPKNIGLALGSGSARGWAHIGVIRALVEAGIEIKYIAGTSIGSIVGAAFALNKLDVLEGFTRQLDWKQIISFLDVAFPRSGLIHGKKISNFFRSHIQDRNIEELPCPFCAVATDLSTGHEVTLKEGDLLGAIRASISVPGIFTPVKKNGSFLVDGVLVNPVPVSTVRNMGAEFVIAVDLNHDTVAKKGASLARRGSPKTKSSKGRILREKWKTAQEQNRKFMKFNTPLDAQLDTWLKKDPLPNIFEVLTSSISIIEAQMTTIRLGIEPPDLLIQPKLGDIKFLEFHRSAEAISEGYLETRTQINEKWEGSLIEEI